MTGMNEKLLKLFKKSGWSNYKLAQETGLTQSTIGRWKNGKVDLRLSSVEAIAKALNVKLKVQK